jgi:hypothetical protein
LPEHGNKPAAAPIQAPPTDHDNIEIALRNGRQVDSVQYLSHF